MNVRKKKGAHDKSSSCSLIQLQLLPYRFVMPANACTLLLIAIAFISVVSFMPWPRSSIQSARHHVRSNAVPVELFVMSKCPDKVFCENVFSQVCKCDTAVSCEATDMITLHVSASGSSASASIP